MPTKWRHEAMTIGIVKIMTASHPVYIGLWAYTSAKTVIVIHSYITDLQLLEDFDHNCCAWSKLSLTSGNSSYIGHKTYKRGFWPYTTLVLSTSKLQKQTVMAVCDIAD